MVKSSPCIRWNPISVLVLIPAAPACSLGKHSRTASWKFFIRWNNEGEGSVKIMESSVFRPSKNITVEIWVRTCFVRWRSKLLPGHQRLIGYQCAYPGCSSSRLAACQWPDKHNGGCSECLGPAPTETGPVPAGGYPGGEPASGGSLSFSLQILCKHEKDFFLMSLKSAVFCCHAPFLEVMLPVCVCV